MQIGIITEEQKIVTICSEKLFINFPVSIGLVIYPLQPEFWGFSSSLARQMRLMPTSVMVGIVWLSSV